MLGVDRSSISAIQRRGGAGLTCEARQRLVVAGLRRGQELQRHLASKPRVFSAVDNPHAAAPEGATIR